VFWFRLEHIDSFSAERSFASYRPVRLHISAAQGWPPFSLRVSGIGRREFAGLNERPACGFTSD
jgi:hypothetical protein